jgi:hypothetical protein
VLGWRTSYLYPIPDGESFDVSNRRRFIFRLSMVLFTAASTVAVGQSVNAAQPLDRTVSSDGIVVTVDHPDCGGKGMTGTEIPTGQLLCTHTAPDFGPKAAKLASTGPPAVLPTSTSAIANDPKCYGDGKSGKRVQAIYAFPQGAPYRPEVVSAIRGVYAKNMEGMVRSESARTGREIGIRFVMPAGCTQGTQIDVAQVMLPADAGQVNGSQFGRIASYLAERGFNRSDRKYHVWWDGNGAACGIGTLLPLAESDPTPANLHNGYYGQQGLFALNMAQSYAPCWGSGYSGATTEIHELFHTLGAVMMGSPRSNKLGHCIDEPDIMCYSEGGVFTRIECAGPQDSHLDCNKNDYFHTNPAPGSYLSTHWNTANSRFLGEFPATDLTPALPPRQCAPNVQNVCVTPESP